MGREWKKAPRHLSCAQKTPEKEISFFCCLHKASRAVNLNPQSCFRLEIFAGNKTQSPGLSFRHLSLYMPSRNYSYEDINRFSFPQSCRFAHRSAISRQLFSRAEIILYGNCFCFFNISISANSLIIRNTLSFALMTQQQRRAVSQKCQKIFKILILAVTRKAFPQSHSKVIRMCVAACFSDGCDVRLKPFP